MQDHMMVPFLIFEEPPYCYSHRPHHFHSHEQGTAAPIVPLCCQHLLSFVYVLFLIIAIITGMS